MARILLVDDDSLVRESIAIALRQADHVVLDVGDGRKALDLLDHETVDLVISDILMPDVDGLGLIMALRKQLPKLRVICISGAGRFGGLNYLDIAGKLGAHSVLRKPFTPKQLLETVESVLRQPPNSER